METKKLIHRPPYTTMYSGGYDDAYKCDGCQRIYNHWERYTPCKYCGSTSIPKYGVAYWSRPYYYLAWSEPFTMGKWTFRLPTIKKRPGKWILRGETYDSTP